MAARDLLGDFLTWLQGDAAAAAAAGAAGGLVRWLTLRENWRDGFVSLVVGSVCAIYLGPLAEPMLRPFVGAISPGQDAAGFSSFVVGLGGVGVAGFVIEALRALRAQRPERPPPPPGPYPHYPPPPYHRRPPGYGDQPGPQVPPLGWGGDPDADRPGMPIRGPGGRDDE